MPPGWWDSAFFIARQKRWLSSAGHSHEAGDLFPGEGPPWCRLPSAEIDGGRRRAQPQLQAASRGDRERPLRRTRPGSCTRAPRPPRTQERGCGALGRERAPPSRSALQTSRCLMAPEQHAQRLRSCTPPSLLRRRSPHPLSPRSQKGRRGPRPPFRARQTTASCTVNYGSLPLSLSLSLKSQLSKEKIRNSLE